LPQTYVNGLPDLFDKQTEILKQFQWFKKERKYH